MVVLYVILWRQVLLSAGFDPVTASDPLCGAGLLCHSLQLQSAAVAVDDFWFSCHLPCSIFSVVVISTQRCYYACAVSG